MSYKIRRRKKVPKRAKRDEGARQRNLSKVQLQRRINNAIRNLLTSVRGDISKINKERLELASRNSGVPVNKIKEAFKKKYGITIREI